MDQVDLVDDGAAGELTGVVAGGGDLLILVVVDELGQGLGEVLQGLRNRVGQFRQIHHRERGALAAGLRRAGGDKVVHDVLADLDRGHGGIGRKLVQPVGIVPADAGLGLFRGDHIVGVIIQHEAGLERCHQAGVKADEVEGDAAVLQGLVDAGEGHAAAARVLFVIAVARDASAAVVPEDQLIPVGGIAQRAPLDKARKGIRIGHGGVAHVGREALEAAALHLIDLVSVGGNHRVVPPGAAAGIDDDADVVRELRLRHLHQVLRGHAAAGFQVGAAHIDHDGNLVVAVAADDGPLVAGALGDRIVHRRGVRIGNLGLAAAAGNILEAGGRDAEVDAGGRTRRGRGPRRRRRAGRGRSGADVGGGGRRLGGIGVAVRVTPQKVSAAEEQKRRDGQQGQGASAALYIPAGSFSPGFVDALGV